MKTDEGVWVGVFLRCECVGQAAETGVFIERDDDAVGAIVAFFAPREGFAHFIGVDAGDVGIVDGHGVGLRFGDAGMFDDGFVDAIEEAIV